MKLTDTLLDWLFPPRCLFCGTLLPEGETSTCPACRDALKALPGERVQTIPTGIRCVSALPYEGIVRQGILRFKFQGCRSSAAAFGAALAQCAAEQLSGQFELVTWVPVHSLRRLSRGYDQSRLLAEAACRLWQVKPVRLLKKRRHTSPNSGMKTASARRANVLGVYQAVRPEAIAGRRILLIDDIVTTGSTLEECARVLKDVGAAEVVCATLAYAERRNPS